MFSEREAAAAPFNEEQHAAFLVDDTLSELAKVERYTLSQVPLQRLAYVKKLGAVAREVGPKDTVNRLLPLIRKIQTDRESVIRQALAEELAQLAKVLMPPGNRDSVDPQLQAAVKSDVVPFVQKLLTDDSQDVRAFASKALVDIAHLVTEEQVGSVILTSVLMLAHDDTEEQRITAVGLLNELAEILGVNLCKNFVAPELASFADDPEYRVRKAAACSFGNVCKVVGPDFTVAKLIHSFHKLCSDSIWGVRKGCVDSLVPIARVLPSEHKQKVVIPLFERFAKDPSRWVRSGAYEVLGPLLHVLGEVLCTPELVKYYANVLQLGDAIDADVILHTAYNFPAVTLTLGPARFPEIVPLFRQLIAHNKLAVRRTLSHSLHELAKIVGPDHTVAVLLPALDLFLRDLDEVRLGVIRNIGVLLQNIPPARRDGYIDAIRDIAGNVENWRWRELLSDQFNLIAPLYSPDAIATWLVPIVMQLCRDRVAVVRNAAAKYVGLFLARLPAGGPAARELIQQVVSFAQSTTFMHRQLFLYICQGLADALPPAMFIDHFLPIVMQLRYDRVPNVRLALARLVYNNLATNAGLKEHADVVTLIEQLKSDRDRDVLSQSRAPPPPTPSPPPAAPASAVESKDVPMQPADLAEADAREIAEIEEMFGRALDPQERAAALRGRKNTLELLTGPPKLRAEESKTAPAPSAPAQSPAQPAAPATPPPKPEPEPELTPPKHTRSPSEEQLAALTSSDQRKQKQKERSKARKNKAKQAHLKEKKKSDPSASHSGDESHSDSHDSDHEESKTEQPLPTASATASDVSITAPSTSADSTSQAKTATGPSTGANPTPMDEDGMSADSARPSATVQVVLTNSPSPSSPAPSSASPVAPAKHTPSSHRVSHSSHEMEVDAEREELQTEDEDMGVASHKTTAPDHPVTPTRPQLHISLNHSAHIPGGPAPDSATPSPVASFSPSLTTTHSPKIAGGIGAISNMSPRSHGIPYFMDATHHAPITAPPNLARVLSPSLSPASPVEPSPSSISPRALPSSSSAPDGLPNLSLADSPSALSHARRSSYPVASPIDPAPPADPSPSVEAAPAAASVAATQPSSQNEDAQ